MAIKNVLTAHQYEIHEDLLGYSKSIFFSLYQAIFEPRNLRDIIIIAHISICFGIETYYESLI